MSGRSEIDPEVTAEDDFDEMNEEECYYGLDFCVDTKLRDHCGCIGCFVIKPPKKAKQ